MRREKLASARAALEPRRTSVAGASGPSSVPGARSFEEFGEFLREVTFEPQRLTTHATYQWLCKQLPDLMARAPGEHIWRCMFLVDLITQYGAARVAKRAKANRTKANRKDKLRISGNPRRRQNIVKLYGVSAMNLVFIVRSQSTCS
jgi:hypothetical protein